MLLRCLHCVSLDMELESDSPASYVLRGTTTKTQRFQENEGKCIVENSVYLSCLFFLLDKTRVLEHTPDCYSLTVYTFSKARYTHRYVPRSSLAPCPPTLRK